MKPVDRVCEVPFPFDPSIHRDQLNLELLEFSKGMKSFRGYLYYDKVLQEIKLGQLDL